MDPGIAGLVIGGSAVGGQNLLNVIGSIFGNSANAEEARKMRKFIEKQATHRYQWTVADLKKAGINPIYAVQGGSAPGVTAGGMPQMENIFGGMTNMGNATKIMDSMVAADKTRAETARVNAETVGQTLRNEGLPSQIAQDLSHKASMTAASNADAMMKRQQVMNLMQQFQFQKMEMDATLPPEIRKQLELINNSTGTDFYSQMMRTLTKGSYGVANAKALRAQMQIRNSDRYPVSRKNTISPFEAGSGVDSYYYRPGDGYHTSGGWINSDGSIDIW